MIAQLILVLSLALLGFSFLLQFTFRFLLLILLDSVLGLFFPAPSLLQLFLFYLKSLELNFEQLASIHCKRSKLRFRNLSFYVQVECDI